MKKIDHLLVKSFLPPFLAAFGIAVFVLLMQYLWVWLDEIVGKGAGVLVIAEMVGYMSISMFPMALPIGVLLASVMVMGNLSEKYELVSFKSAGVSLSRVILPLVVVCSLISVFSFICSNHIIPLANLKFRSRLYDIKKKKPSLSLQQGVFNTDFNGYVMHIKELDKDDNSMSDVVIYDQRAGMRSDINQIVATDGTIKPTKDNQFLVMTLNQGNHYQETRGAGYKRTYPFVRTSFKSWEKIFDLREFNLARTNEDLFKNNETMMSAPQIREAIDSLTELRAERTFAVQKTVAGYYSIYDKIKIIQDSSRISPDTIPARNDGAKPVIKKQLPAAKTPIQQIKNERQIATLKRSDTSRTEALVVEPDTSPKETFYWQTVFDSLPVYKKQVVLQTAKTRLTTLQGRLTNRGRSLNHTIESRIKHIYQLHMKYSTALVCLVFLFIGAPMGAIVRKGGFGYPVLIAIIFFMLYIVLTLTFKKLSYGGVVLPEFGAWLPCILMIPFGALLTHRALNDKKIMEIGQHVEKVKVFFRKVLPKRWVKAKLES